MKSNRQPLTFFPVCGVAEGGVGHGGDGAGATSGATGRAES